MFKRHLAFSEASDRQHHSKVLYLNLFKRTTTCVVAKPLVMIKVKRNIPNFIEQKPKGSEIDHHQKLF